MANSNPISKAYDKLNYHSNDLHLDLYALYYFFMLIFEKKNKKNSFKGTLIQDITNEDIPCNYLLKPYLLLFLEPSPLVFYLQLLFFVF